MKTQIIRLSIFVFCVASFSMYIACATAESSSDDGRPRQEVPDDFLGPKRPTVSIEGKEYLLGNIWAGFLQIAFSETVWNEEPHIWPLDSDHFPRMLEWYSQQSWDLNDSQTGKKYESQKHYRPWYAEYLYRPDGWPRQGVLHKWENEITIGLGWPPYSPGNQARLPYVAEKRPEDFPLGNTRDNESKTDQFFPLIADEVQKLLPAIQQDTGLKTAFILPNDPRDFSADYARIRIIPVTGLSTRYPGPIGKNIPSVTDYERLLWGGVLFESSDLVAMDGFLLPKPDNTLGLAVCKIRVVGVTEHLFRALVQECVMRALGLPDIGSRSSLSLLGDWRKAVIANAFGPNRNRYDDTPDSEYLMPPYRTGIFADTTMVKVDSELIPAMNTLDRAMIRLLYCPALKSGMDKNEVIRTLAPNKACSFETPK